MSVDDILPIWISAMDHFVPVQIPMHIFEIDGVQLNRWGKLCELECKFCLSYLEIIVHKK